MTQHITQGIHILLLNCSSNEKWTSANMFYETNIHSVYPEEALAGTRPNQKSDLKGLNILIKWRLHSKSDQYTDCAKNTKSRTSQNIKLYRAFLFYIDLPPVAVPQKLLEQYTSGRLQWFPCAEPNYTGHLKCRQLMEFTPQNKFKHIQASKHKNVNWRSMVENLRRCNVKPTTVNLDKRELTQNL